MVIRESSFNSFLSIVNLVSPAFSKVQNLLFLRTIFFPSKTIAPRPSRSVDTSKMNGDSFCACSKIIYLIKISRKRFLEKSQLTNESAGFSSGACVVGSVGISIGGGFDGCSGKPTLDKFFISKRRNAIPSVRFLIISSLTVNRLFIFSIFSSIVERTCSIWKAQIPSLFKWKTNENFIIRKLF